MGYITQEKDYWIHSNALSITLNALGNANRIQCSVSSGAVIMAFIDGDTTLGYNAAHNYKSWPLSASPTYFNSNTAKYVYVAIPRTDSIGTQAVVVFPSEKLDIDGRNAEDAQIGSTDYLYIYIGAKISATDGTTQRTWENALLTGKLDTAQGNAERTQETEWYQWSTVLQTVTFLKKIVMAPTSWFHNLILGDDKKELTGVATAATGEEYVNSETLVVTPSYLSGKYLSKTHDDTAAGNITFQQDITVGGMANMQKDVAVGGNLGVRGWLKALTGIFGSIKSDNYTGDNIGDTGYHLTADDGSGASKLTVDKLYVRMKAVFEELQVNRERVTGGNHVFSCAANVINRTDYYNRNNGVDRLLGYTEIKMPWTLRGVPTFLSRLSNAIGIFSSKNNIRVELPNTNDITFIRCYFLAKEGDEDVMNLWQGNDLARCQTFNLNHKERETYVSGTTTQAGNVFWWRKVIGVSSTPVEIEGRLYHYFDVSMSDCAADSDLPAAGDHVSQWGNTTNTERMNLRTIEVNGTGAPVDRWYRGIYTYDMSKCWWGGNPCKDKISAADGVEFYGPTFKYVQEYGVERVATDRGEWNDITATRDDYSPHGNVRKCYYNDRVSHNGSLWLCSMTEGYHWVADETFTQVVSGTSKTFTQGNAISDSDYAALTTVNKTKCSRKQNYTTQEPSDTATDWTKQVDKGSDGQNAVSVDIDNEHEDFLYNDAGVNVSGNVTSQAHLYDGQTDKTNDVTWEIRDSDSGAWGSSTNTNAIASISNTSGSKGLLTVTGLKASSVKIQIRAKYPATTGSYYYAEFTANKTNQDKYDLVLTPSAIPFNPATYSTQNIAISASRLDLSGIKTDLSFGNYNDKTKISTTSDKGYLRLFATITRAVSPGTYSRLPAQVTSSSFSVTSAIANTDKNVYFELRKYDNCELSDTYGISGTLVDYETVPINKAENGAAGKNAIRLALDNEHEDFIYSESGLVAPSGGATSQIRLYDGHVEKEYGTDFIAAIDSNQSSGATASISNTGVLTVSGLTDDTGVVVVKAEYPANSGEYYYAKFTGNKISQDKYDLKMVPNAIAFNASEAWVNKTITPSAERTDLQGNKYTNQTIHTTEVDGLRVYFNLVKSDGTFRNQNFNLLDRANYILSEYNANNNIGVYFELRLYEGSDYRLCDYETVEIARTENGTSPWIADLDNEMDSVACDSDKHPIATQSIQTTIALFHGITEQSFTIASDGLKRNGTAMTWDSTNQKWNATGLTVTFDSSTKVLTITYTTAATINVKDEFTITLTNSTITRNLVVTVNGIKGDAKYNLVPSVSSVVKNPNNNTYSPTTLTCSYTKIDIAKGQNIDNPTDGTIKYTKDGGSTEYAYSTALTAGTDFTSEVTFLLYVGTALVDKERIPVVKDGTNGINGQNTIRVDLDNEMDSMLYDGAGNKLSGNIVCHAYLFDGISDKTSDATWALSASGCTISSSTGSTITVTAVSNTDATVTATATYGGKTYSAVMSIKKIVNADKYDLDVTPNALSLNTDDGWSANKVIDIKVMRTPAGGGTPTAVNPSTYGLTLAATIGTLSSYDSTNNKFTLTITETQATNNDNTVITLYKTSATNVYDRETIPFNRNENGRNGQDMRENIIDNSEGPHDIIVTSVNPNASGYRYYATKMSYNPNDMPADGTKMSGRACITLSGCTFTSGSTPRVYLYTTSLVNGSGVSWPAIIDFNPTTNGTFDIKLEGFVINSKGSGSVAGEWNGVVNLRLDHFEGGTVTFENVKLEVAETCSDWCLSENDKQPKSLDLSNEMDMVPTTSTGKITTARTISTIVRLFNGSTEVDISAANVTVSGGPASSIATFSQAAEGNSGKGRVLSWAFIAGQTMNDSYEITASYTYKYRPYSQKFIIKASKGQAVYQIKPSMSSVPFAYVNGAYDPPSRNVGLKIVKIDGSSSSNLNVFSSTGTVDSGKVFVRYSTSSMPALKTEGTAWPTGTDTTVAVSNSGVTNLYIAIFNTDGLLLDRETVPVVKDGVKGDQGIQGNPSPFYEKIWYAWSNEVSTASITTSPFSDDSQDPTTKDPTSGYWTEGAIPQNIGNLAYLWRRSVRRVYNSTTGVYDAENAQYVRMSGTDGTSISVKGTIDYAYSSVSSLPPATSSLAGKKAIVKSDNKIYTCTEMQGGVYDWFPGSPIVTASDGDSYTVVQGNFNGSYQSANVLAGHLVMWSTEASDWVDLGQFKGDSGVTYYTHIAWATNVTFNGSAVTSVEGFVTVKAPNDTTHRWMGVYIDRNSGQDPQNATLYTWSYVNAVLLKADPENIIITQSTVKQGNTYPLIVVDVWNNVDIYGYTQLKIADGSVEKTTGFTVGTPVPSTFLDSDGVTTKNSCTVVKNGTKVGISAVGADSENGYVTDGYVIIPVTYGGNSYSVRLNFYCNLLGKWKVSVENGTETAVASRLSTGIGESGVTTLNEIGTYIRGWAENTSRVEKGVLSDVCRNIVLPITSTDLANQIIAVKGGVPYNISMVVDLRTSPSGSVVTIVLDGGGEVKQWETSTGLTFEINDTVTFPNDGNYRILVDDTAETGTEQQILSLSLIGVEVTMSELKQTTDSITAQVVGLDGRVSTVEQTATGLTSTVAQIQKGKNMLKNVLSGDGWMCANTSITPHALSQVIDNWFYCNSGDSYIISPAVNLGIGTYTIAFDTPYGAGTNVNIEVRLAGVPFTVFATGQATGQGARKKLTFVMESTQNVYVYIAAERIHYPQLEMGSVATDFEANTGETISQITQTANEIDLEVRNDLEATGINISTGKVAVQADNFTIGKNGTQVFGVDSNTGMTTMQDVDIKGSLMFHKVVVEKTYNSLAIANASATIHTSIKADIFIIGKEYSTFEISFPPAYLFKGAQVRIIIGVENDITYELFVTRLSAEQAMYPSDQYAAGWPPYNCFYAAIPITSYGSSEYGRLEMMQLSSGDYHCLDLVSVINPEYNGVVPSGQPDAGNPYYVWMLIDAR